MENFIKAWMLVGFIYSIYSIINIFWFRWDELLKEAGHSIEVLTSYMGPVGVSLLLCFACLLILVLNLVIWPASMWQEFREKKE